MISIMSIDILFFSTILSLIFIYAYVGRFIKKKDIKYKLESFKSNDNDKREIYESDKYKDLYEDLPWEDEDEYLEENECKPKYMDSLQMMFSGDIRRKSKMTIY